MKSDSDSTALVVLAVVILIVALMVTEIRYQLVPQLGPSCECDLCNGDV